MVLRPDHRNVEQQVPAAARPPSPAAGRGRSPARRRGAAWRRCLPWPRPRRRRARRWRRSGRCRSRPARSRCGGRSRCRSLVLGGGLRLGQHALAGQQRLEQRGRIRQPYAFVASTLATPPISASVFFCGSEASSLTSRQSGTMREKILACFTCPDIMTSVMPSSLQMSISLLSCAERDPVAARGQRLDFRRGFLLDARSRPPRGPACARSRAPASGTGRCRRSWRVAVHLMKPRSEAAMNSSSSSTSGHGSIFGADPLDGLRGVQPGARQQPERLVQRVARASGKPRRSRPILFAPKILDLALGHGGRRTAARPA